MQGQQTITVERVDHIGIRVRDLDRALISIERWASTFCTRPQVTTLRSSETTTAWS
jgi:hypothetical protein